MANLDEKQLEEAGKKPNKNESASIGTDTGEQKLEKKIDYIKWLITGIIAVLIAIIFGMFVAFLQMQQQNYSDYKNTLNNIMDKRWTNIEERLIQLEIKIASSSAR